MVYGLAVLCAPAASRFRLAAGALAVSVLVELSRLVNAPALDAVRLTTTGALLLGRVFSPWNVVAYAAGIAAAWCCDAGAARPRAGFTWIPRRSRRA